MEGITDSNEISAEAKEQVESLLKTQFRPEFLNRLDEIVFYKPLAKSEIGSIVDLMIKDLSRRLEDKQIKVNITESAKSYIIDSGYDAVYGARPLKRFIQSKVETLIAKAIVGDALREGDTVVIDSGSDGRALEVKG